MRTYLAVALNLLLLVSCKEGIQEEGHLPNGIDENSGMAISHKTGRMFTIQDSGNKPEVYMTEQNGKLLQKFKVKATNEDWEAISWGPCYDDKSKYCVFVADIGDNTEDRDHATIYYFPEPEVGVTSVTPKKFDFVYEDGPQNAEGFVVHPVTGEMYVCSKKYPDDGYSPSWIYTLNPPLATKFMKIDLKGEMNQPEQDTRIGDMTMPPSGSFFLLTTVDSGKFWKVRPGGSIEKVTVPILGQEESATMPTEDEVIYSSEGTTELVRHKVR